MDYNDFEIAAFWVLSFAAAVPMVILGVLVHLRCGARARGRYLFLGCLASIIYGLFAGVLVNAMFPPPYVQGLSEGRGLDLRGTALILGSWVGGILGFIAVVTTSLVSSWMRRRTARRKSVPQQLPNP
ncbi:hypothetical protein FQ154_07840 [Paeniglutamicibacter gangotriensis]|uniref:Uncharacterized protein n=1 Tax=Paeniglutamicibacter gangotriensis TaxID=254787 RepID=A0A5B0EJV6_9MICC|nr:hypothetical protein [Paeniglutamicibacter gangotriensis]KAA0977609.1 hypothetical protein FQ154_07840 [Paeniglutamicibacter gangotriensis]